MELRKRIPSCSSQSSKAVILKKAIEYIDYLVKQKVGTATLEEGKVSNFQITFSP